jgi:urease accessory protein
MPTPGTVMTTAEPRISSFLYRLLAWLSPGFPTGGFSYSHGLEAAVAGGAVRDRDGLVAWVAAILAHGGGRIDGDILCSAYRAASAGDLEALGRANRRGVVFRATAELSSESAQQGEAFLAACRAAWPDAVLEGWAGDDSVCHAAAFGAAAAQAGIALEDALLGYLEAFAANLVSAGLRLGLIGHTGAQRVVAELEPVVCAAARAAMSRDPGDFGAATFAVDLASMVHETQYSRLFRS